MSRKQRGWPAIADVRAPQHVWATRRDASYLYYVALHFTVHGAFLALNDAAGPYTFVRRRWRVRQKGFYVFYNSIFSLFCPLWVGETNLNGLRMVRLHVDLVRRSSFLTMRALALAQDYCLRMPASDAQSTLPQYFLLKARRTSVLERRSLTPVQRSGTQEFPNYAPDAAPPLFRVKDLVMYESHMNPAVCRGSSLLENCMIDRFFIPVEASE